MFEHSRHIENGEFIKIRALVRPLDNTEFLRTPYFHLGFYQKLKNNRRDQVR